MLLTWLLRGRLPTPLGPYNKVGKVSFDLKDPDIPFCNVYFPVSDTSSNSLKNGKPEKYTRKAAIEGFKRATGGVTTILKATMYSARHPYITENLFSTDVAPFDGDLPLVVFSHGIKSNADLYSAVCSDMASTGVIVVALEHRDKSGAYAETVDNDPIYYYEPEAAYTRENVLAFRGPQLEQRVEEIKNVMNMLLNKNSYPSKLPGLLRNVFQKINQDKIFLSGHSFGAGTTFTAAHAFEKEGYLSDKIKGYMVLDPWTFPVNEKALEEGVKKPIISLRGEEFALNKEGQTYTDRILNNSNCKLNGYMEGVIHTQFSDAPYFTQNKKLRKKLQMSGSLDVKISQKAIFDCMSNFMKDPEGFSKASIQDKNSLDVLKTL